MAVSSKFNTKFQKKSISLPCRSHPSTIQIEEELNKIKASSAAKPSAETICNGLSQLAKLYECLDDLLDLSATKDLICSHQNEKWVLELIDGSVKFLDICSITRDVVLEIKEHVRDLQCDLRRRNDDLNTESSIVEYSRFMKKMKKDAKRLIASLKQGENTNGGSHVADSDHHHLAAVIRVAVEVSEMTVSIFESLLIFLSASSTKPVKPNRWSLVVSKLVHKGAVTCQGDQEQTTNELESVDAALSNLISASCEGDKMQIAQCRLEAMEDQIGKIESGLEFIFRRMIRTRASLLNIISH